MVKGAKRGQKGIERSQKSLKMTQNGQNRSNNFPIKPLKNAMKNENEPNLAQNKPLCTD